MHEISLLESVLDILQTQAQQQGFQKITQVHLEIGALSCVAQDALQFGFAAVMKGSLAEHAELVISTVPGQGFCTPCQQTVALETLHDPCPRCGRFGVTLTAGQQLRIKECRVI
jgi:hydrogenase nickel incorporation protein HypA/HybF